MSLIPSKFALKEGDAAPEGSLKCKCRFCNTQYAIPAEESNGKTFIDVCDSEECKTAYDKEIAAATAALMKNPSEGQEIINKALGK